MTCKEGLFKMNFVENLGHKLHYKVIYPLNPDSAKPKITNWVKTAQLLSNEWLHFRVLSVEAKVRKLCITQCFTLGVRGDNQ